MGSVPPTSDRRCDPERKKATGNDHGQAGYEGPPKLQVKTLWL